METIKKFKRRVKDYVLEHPNAVPTAVTLSVAAIGVVGNVKNNTPEFLANADKYLGGIVDTGRGLAYKLATDPQPLRALATVVYTTLGIGSPIVGSIAKDKLENYELRNNNKTSQHEVIQKYDRPLKLPRISKESI